MRILDRIAGAANAALNNWRISAGHKRYLKKINDHLNGIKPEWVHEDHWEVLQKSFRPVTFTDPVSGERMMFLYPKEKS